MVDHDANLKAQNEGFARVIKAKTHAKEAINTLTFDASGYCIIKYSVRQYNTGDLKNDYIKLRNALSPSPNDPKDTTVTMDVTATPMIKVDMQACTTRLYHDFAKDVLDQPIGAQR